MTPSALTRRTASSSSWTTAGASPSDSSSMSSSLRPQQERLREREHLPLAAGERPGALAAALGRDAGTARAPRPAASAVDRLVAPDAGTRPSRRFSATVSPGKMPRPPGTWTMPRAAVRSGCSPVIGSPSNQTLPPSGSTMPEMALSVVDLPAPLVPSSATISPSPDLEVDAEQHLHAAVGDGQALHLQQHRAARPPRRARSTWLGSSRSTSSSRYSAAWKKYRTPRRKTGAMMATPHRSPWMSPDDEARRAKPDARHRDHARPGRTRCYGSPAGRRPR